MKAVPESLESWLKEFAKAVRDRDFTAGKKLFDGDVTAFGTVCFRVENLEELSARQWQPVWTTTRDFDFNYATARADVENNLATVLAEWTSTGFDAAQHPFLRQGRATIVLRRTAAEWKATHTHFSFTPPSNIPHVPLLRHPGSSASAPRVP